jgi:hypothetical protein
MQVHEMVCLIMGRYNDCSVAQWENENRTLKYWSHDSLAENIPSVLLIPFQLSEVSNPFPPPGNAKKFLVF